MSLKEWKRKIGIIYIKYRIRVGMGGAYTAELESLKNALQSGGVVMLLWKSYFGYLPPLWVLPLGWITQRAGEYFIGLLDEKWLHYQQAQNNYTSRQLNPFNEELLKRIVNIENKVKKL